MEIKVINKVVVKKIWSKPTFIVIDSDMVRSGGNNGPYEKSFTVNHTYTIHGAGVNANQFNNYSS